MLWKLIVPAIDAGYDDLAEVLALVSFVLNIASVLHEHNVWMHNEAMLRGCTVEEMVPADDTIWF